MTGSPRILGKQLSIEIDGVEYMADTTSCILKNEDNGDTVITFADANAGDVKKYFFEISAIQSTASASFWSMVWDNQGEEVPFTYAVHGNATVTADQPLLIGTLEIGAPPELGGEAGRKKTYVFSTRFDIIGTPTLDRTP